MGQKYVTQTVSGFNAAPPSDDGSITDANKIKWSGIKTKLGDPLNTAIVAIDAALVTAFAQEALLKTTNYTTTAGDNGKLLEVTGTNTISLYDASTGGASYQVNVLNLGVGVVTVGRATAGNTINAVAGNWTLNPGNGASFRVNSTNNGYDVIGTALTTGAGLADVVHTTGTENIGGSKTFTNVPAISMANPRLDIKDTGQTLPAGLWAVQSTGTNFRVLRNLAGAGDFSSATVPFIISSADVATFTGTVTGAAAVAATDFVRKDQLESNGWGGFAGGTANSITISPTPAFTAYAAGQRIRFIATATNTAAVTMNVNSLGLLNVFGEGGAALLPGDIVSGAVIEMDNSAGTNLRLVSPTKVYGGQVSSTGTAVYLPAGWSSSRSALGNYTITHNLGTTSYAPVVTAAGGGTHAAYFALAINSFQVATTNTGALVDAAFAFTVARN